MFNVAFVFISILPYVNEVNKKFIKNSLLLSSIFVQRITNKLACSHVTHSYKYVHCLNCCIRDGYLIVLLPSQMSLMPFDFSFSKVWQTEGWKAFFKGGACRMMVIAPLFGIAQTVYYLGVAEWIMGIPRV